MIDSYLLTKEQKGENMKAKVTKWLAEAKKRMSLVQGYINTYESTDSPTEIQDERYGDHEAEAEALEVLIDALDEYLSAV